MDKIKDQIFNVINDNSALAQVFIIILFFEDYQIIVQKTSLLNTTIDFDKVSLQPFILFFVFIAMGKVLWFLWHLLLLAIKSKMGLSGDGEIYKKVSVNAFLLCILLLVYIGLVMSNEGVIVSLPKDSFWFRTVLAIPLFAAVICFIMSLQSVEYNDEKK